MTSKWPTRGGSRGTWGQELLDALQSQAHASSNAYYARLMPFYAALATRDSSPCDIGILGASIVEGYLANAHSKTTPQQLARIMRARFPTNGLTSSQGGRGFIGTASAAMVTSANWPVAYTSGTFDPATDTSAGTFLWGSKRRVWYGTAAGHKIVQTLNGSVTSADIKLVRGSGGSATGGYYKIDGGASVTFSTFSASTALATVTIGAATTSIEVGWNAGGACIVDGIVEYNGDETKGIRVHNFGHASFTTALWNNVGGVVSSNSHASIAAFNLDLLIIQDLAITDAYNGSRTAAQAKSDLTSFIAALRASGVSCPILLSAVYDTTGAPSQTFPEPYANYVTAWREISESDSTIAFFDHSSRMPATAAANTYGLYYTDLLHTSVNGTANLYLAENLAHAISPR